MVFEIGWENVMDDIFLEIFHELLIPILKKIIFLFAKYFNGFCSMIIFEGLNNFTITELSL